MAYSYRMWLSACSLLWHTAPRQGIQISNCIIMSFECSSCSSLIDKSPIIGLLCDAVWCPNDCPKAQHWVCPFVTKFPLVFSWCDDEIMKIYGRVGAYFTQYLSYAINLRRRCVHDQIDGSAEAWISMVTEFPLWYHDLTRAWYGVRVFLTLLGLLVLKKTKEVDEKARLRNIISFFVVLHWMGLGMSPIMFSGGMGRESKILRKYIFLVAVSII